MGYIPGYENEKIYIKVNNIRGRMFINYGFIIKRFCVHCVAIL